MKILAIIPQESTCDSNFPPAPEGGVQKGKVHFSFLLSDVCFSFALTLRMELMKPSRMLLGSWARKPFCVPRFLFVGNRLQPPWPSLSSKGQVQTVANQGREGIQVQGKGSQETIAQPWDRILVPPQWINITISLSSSAEPSTNGRC